MPSFSFQAIRWYFFICFLLDIRLFKSAGIFHTSRYFFRFSFIYDICITHFASFLSFLYYSAILLILFLRKIFHFHIYRAPYYYTFLFLWGEEEYYMAGRFSFASMAGRLRAASFTTSLGSQPRRLRRRRASPPLRWYRRFLKNECLWSYHTATTAKYFPASPPMRPYLLFSLANEYLFWCWHWPRRLWRLFLLLYLLFKRLHFHFSFIFARFSIYAFHHCISLLWYYLRYRLIAFFQRSRNIRHEVI